jgi:hypothetical protein
VLVYKENGTIMFSDEHLITEDFNNDMLRPIFKDGKILNEETFFDIRVRLAQNHKLETI